MTSPTEDDPPDLAARQAAARHWFEQLQSRLVAAFERMEDLGPAHPGAHGEVGRFARKPWSRTDHTGAPGGGGTMAVLKGRVFEKAGIHSSTVFGSFAPEFASQIPGASEDPRFWASGVSLIAHPWNPNVPAVHMNTRFVVTSKAWFGGGADLTPVLDARRVQTDPDALTFHAAMKAACDAHAAVAPYDKFKAWCEEYFFLKHRNEPRGIGGIFFDYLDGESGFAPHFAFTRAVGDAFLDVYPRIVAANVGHPSARSKNTSSWSDADATSSSTCSTIAERFLGCGPAAMSSRSCRPCHHGSNGLNGLLLQQSRDQVWATIHADGPTGSGLGRHLAPAGRLGRRRLLRSDPVGFFLGEPKLAKAGRLHLLRLLGVAHFLHHLLGVGPALLAHFEAGFGPCAGFVRKDFSARHTSVAAGPAGRGRSPRDASRSLGLGAGSSPSRCACFLASLRARRTASAASRTRLSDGFSNERRIFISRMIPSRCILRLRALRACSMLLSRTRTCNASLLKAAAERTSGSR